MSKATKGNMLPRKLQHHIQIVGEQIKLARLRRDLSLQQIADRAMCSLPTVMNVESGKATVSIGIYLRILYALQMEDDILLIAKDDPLGRLAQDMELKQRKRASRKAK